MNGDADVTTLLNDANEIVGYYLFDENLGEMQTVCPACATAEERRDFITAHDVAFKDAVGSASDSWEENHPEDCARLDRCDRCKKAIDFLV
jgi:hypothetical protein